jgi:predicted aspartyl protease
MSPIVPPRPMAITVTAEGLLREIISPAQVSKYFPPGADTNIKKVDINALWDTGATGSAITRSTVKELALVPISKTRVVYGKSESVENVYLVCIILLKRVIFAARVTECDDKTYFGLIIGMDIITRGDFSLTNKGNKTKFSFRYPSIADIDFVKEENEKNKSMTFQNKRFITAPMRNNKVDGNLPCPCGSGKKWKQCHGKEKSAFHR